MATEVMTGGDREVGSPRGPLARLVQFLRDVRNELRKVTWPTFDELKKATTVIVIFVAVLGLVIGLMDTLFQEIFVTMVAKLF